MYICESKLIRVRPIPVSGISIGRYLFDYQRRYQ